MLSITEPSFVRTFIKSPVFNDLFNYNAYSISKYEHLNFTKETNKNQATYSIDIPGVKKENIQITLENDIINIDWKRNKKEFKYYFMLPKQYDNNNSSAILENGVLTLAFELRKEMKPKKIKIDIK